MHGRLVALDGEQIVSAGAKRNTANASQQRLDGDGAVCDSRATVSPIPG